MRRFPAVFAGAATGIGSLPHRLPDEAVQLALYADVPYWPQLPQRHADEAMLRQFATPGAPSLPDRTAGLWALAAALGDTRLPALKGQITGPITMGGPGDWLTLATSLATKATWQTRWLQRWADEVLIVVDEPALATITESDREAAGTALTTVFTAIRRAGGVAGVHCCGEADWEWLLGLAPDVVSFDLAHGPPLGLLARHVMAGGGIIWGCLPTESDPDIATAEQQLRLRWRAGALDPQTWLAHAMLSPACGLGLTPLARAERISHALYGLTVRWRDAGLPPG
jgi:hypothetical protein